MMMIFHAVTRSLFLFLVLCLLCEDAKTQALQQCCDGQISYTVCKYWASDQTLAALCPSDTLYKETVSCPVSMSKGKCYGGCSCAFCSSGQYEYQAPTKFTDRKCTNCPMGQFVNFTKHTKTSCDECPDGQYQDSVGASSCKNKVTCKLGEFSTGRKLKLGSCVKCGFGMYNNVAISDACKQCPFGQYQDATGQTKCKPKTRCNRGEYVDGGSIAVGVCQLCPKGQMRPNDDHTSDCYACIDGKYADQLGSSVCKWKTICSAGEYVDGGVYSVGTCQQCPSGTYRGHTSHLLASCESCPKGEYQDEKGKMNCKPCPEGQYQDETGKNSCKKDPECRDGFAFEKNSLMAAGCRACPSGQYAVAGDTTCTPCAPGYWSQGQEKKCEIKTVCDAGFYSNGDEFARGYCASCPPGYVKRYKSSYPCDSCPIGQYQASSGKEFCDTKQFCKEGEYSNGGQTTRGTCTNCPAGKYQDSNSHRYHYCKDCPIGQYTKYIAGAISCSAKVRCAMGLYADGGATAKGFCKTCPTGKYTDVAGLTSCKSCPAGQYSLGDSCMTCPAGKYNRYESGACVTCAAGWYQDGSDPTKCDKTLVYCRAGERFVNKEVFANSFCEDCPPGTRSPHVVPHRVQSCDICANGKYSENPKSFDCTPQPPCKQGTYFKLADKDSKAHIRECIACEPGKFQDGDNHKEESCDDHTMCNPDLQYETHPGNSSQNKKCLNLTVCGLGLYEKVAPTFSSNRVCGKCNNGFSEDGEELVECPVGKCQSGQRSLNDLGDECEPCSLGEYQTAVNHTFPYCLSHSCPQGTYLANMEDATSNSSCLQCPNGTFRSENMHEFTICEDQTVCSKGEKMVNGSDISSGACEECNASNFEYMDEEMHRNQECKIGFCGKNESIEYVEMFVTIQCVQCDSKSYIDEESHQETACKKVLNCPQHSYFDGDVEGTRDPICLPCGKNEYQSNSEHRTRICNKLSDCIQNGTHYLLPGNDIIPYGQCLPHPICNNNMELQVNSTNSPGECVPSTSPTPTDIVKSTDEGIITISHSRHVTTKVDDNIVTTTITGDSSITQNKVSNDESKKESAVSVGMVAGIIGGIIVALLIVLMVVRSRKKRKNAPKTAAIHTNKAYIETPEGQTYYESGTYEEPNEGEDYSTLSKGATMYGEGKGKGDPNADYYAPMKTSGNMYESIEREQSMEYYGPMDSSTLGNDENYEVPEEGNGNNDGIDYYGTMNSTHLGNAESYEVPQEEQNENGGAFYEVPVDEYEVPVEQTRTESGDIYEVPEEEKQSKVADTEDDIYEGSDYIHPIPASNALTLKYKGDDDDIEDLEV
eukprot:m.8631 g.8631  ORF g.8631 m.8631 type:complete len:1321 (-) comp3933_c0_seq1:321-4283(-)